MEASPEVLIVSHERDVHALEVAGRLSRMGVSCSLADTGAMSDALAIAFDPLAAASTVLHTQEETVLLHAVRAVWWRRPRPVTISARIRHPGIRWFCSQQCEQALSGLWLCLKDALWVNPPSRDRDAHSKPYQLLVASRVGLKTPRTLITNHAESARTFAAMLGESGAVHKLLICDERHWRETRRVTDQDLDMLEKLQYAPAIFQECVAGQLDIRATIVGERVFAASIDATQGRYPLDYRMDFANARIAQHALPPDVSSHLLNLCKQLGLVYGAADLRLTPEGEYVFLEINPAGEWLFIEHATGLPISDAISTTLAAAPAGGAT